MLSKLHLIPNEVTAAQSAIIYAHADPRPTWHHRPAEQALWPDQDALHWHHQNIFRKYYVGESL
jgi:hypothetical protein